MTQLTDYLRELLRSALTEWNRFWFTAEDPATLGLIRILAGAMLFYTHLVWTLGLDQFFFPSGALDPEFIRDYHASPWAWSHFNWIDSPLALWIIHVASLVVFLMLTVGMFSRVTSVLAFLITVSYAHRVPVALFGLDQINALLAMYLMIGPCGDVYSFDCWRTRRRIHASNQSYAPSGSVSANISVRLIQVHMCIIYLFAGAGKLLGQSWWDGTAMWGALANLEYQTLDMTWLCRWPIIVNLLTHVVVVWELSYCVLIWPRILRPIVLLLALPLHLGIAICMGMVTFGLVMLIGNLAFVSPLLVRSCLSGGRQTGATRE